VRKKQALIGLVCLVLVLTPPLAYAKKEEDEDRSFYTIDPTYLDSYAEHNWGYGSESGVGHSMADGDYFNLYLDWSPSQGISFKVGLYNYTSQEVITSSLQYPTKAGYTQIEADEDGVYCIAIVNLSSNPTTYSGYYYVVN